MASMINTSRSERLFWPRHYKISGTLTADDNTLVVDGGILTVDNDTSMVDECTLTVVGDTLTVDGSTLTADDDTFAVGGCTLMVDGSGTLMSTVDTQTINDNDTLISNGEH
jgi:hypothetical protein